MKKTIRSLVNKAICAALVVLGAANVCADVITNDLYDAVNTDVKVGYKISGLNDGKEEAVVFTKDSYDITWNVPANLKNVEYLIVGGGGGGGSSYASGTRGAGGGGAGGFANSTLSGFESVSQVLINVGGKGAAGASGSPSKIVIGDNEYSVYGGGAGGKNGYAGTKGGSGGGGSGANKAGGGVYNSDQGNKGGSSLANYAGGGGGAGDAGEDGVSGQAGKGGPGKVCDITGEAIYYAAGGGGGGYTPGAGGIGGGGAGGAAGKKGSAATGWGCGGGGTYQNQNGGAGYQGIVVLRYAYNFKAGDNFYFDFASAAENVAENGTIQILNSDETSGSLNKSVTLQLADGVSYTGTITLAAADAVLTAPEGLNVATTVANSEVKFENGAYTVVEAVVTISLPNIDNATWVYDNENVTGSITVNKGTAVELTLNAADGYQFANGETSVKVTFDSVNENIAADNSVFNNIAAPQQPVVAKIGDVSYATLQAAIDAAQSGETIVVLTDIALAEGVVIASDDVITIDLNGKTISRNTETTVSTAAITNNGNLTIQDSSTEKTGKITAFAANPDTASVPYYASNTITNCGVLTITGGTIENSTSNDARAAFPIDNNSTSRDAIVNIEGGTITGRGAIRQFANSTVNKNEVNISGGVVNGTSYGLWMQNPGSGDPKATLTVSGGNVAKILLSPSANFEPSITGGTIAEVAIWSADAVNAERNPSGFITGGTFSTDVSDFCADGFEVTSNGDGIYGVVEKAKLVGSGTEADPFVIGTIDDLKLFRDMVNGGTTFANQFVKMTADIDLNNVAWDPIGSKDKPFKGTFNGDGKKVCNLVVAGGANQGFFGYADNCVIKNLNLENVNVKGTDCVGAIAGQVYSVSTIDNCHVSGNIKVEGQTNVGGIVGKYYVRVTNSSVIGDDVDTSYVKGVYVASDFEGDNVGGIMGHGGESNNFVGNTVKNITISGTRKVGGIVGTTTKATNVSAATVENVVVATTATAEYSASKADSMGLGGLIGHYYSTSAGGTISENTVKGVTFSIPDGITAEAGVVVGNDRTAVGAEPTGVTVENLTVENITGATQQYLIPMAVQVGTTKYMTLVEAAAAAKAGDEIVLLADVIEDVTVPAGVIFNGNGKQVGVITAAGTITFKGVTKAANFGVQFTNTEINIGEGACLEITGTGRLVIGHGCTFNITGTIADAKTADKATLTPSLIAPGASFTGAGVTFNANNAYVKFTAYCSSKNSNASGIYNINVTNSIWEQSGSLVFSEPTNGKDPTFNFNLKDSVLDSTSHLVFAVTKGEIVFDNSNVNVGVYRQLENRSTLTIKNGSVVYAAHATSSNAKNPGTTIVENATYVATGDFSGSDVGTGTLIVKKGASVTMGKITGANVVVDATDMVAGDVIDLNANLSTMTGTIEVINNDKLEASIVDGKIVLAAKPVAEIDGVKYGSLREAISSLKDGDTLTIYAGEISEGTIKFPASLKNVTIKGETGAILKDMTLMACDGSNIAYEGITFDGIVFDNSNILFPGQRASASFKNWTITNCEFKNVSRGNAAVSFNLNTSEAMENFTFTNNVIDGVTGGNYSGLVLRASKGNVVISGNDIKNVVWNAVQLINSTADTLTIEDNRFASGADEGILNLYGVTAATLTIKENQFLVAENQPGICYIESADVSLNYWGGEAPANLPGGVTFSSYYTTAEDGVLGGLVELPDGTLAGTGTEADPFVIASLADLELFRDSVNNGETTYNTPGVWVALAADIDMGGVNWVGIGSINQDHGFMGNFDGNGFKVMNLTITNPALDSDGYAYAGLFSITEGTDQNNQNTIKNLTIENVTIDTTGHIVSAAIAYPYYTIVDNVKVCGNISIKGGDYTAGALAYTRRCVNASNVSVVGNEDLQSVIEGTRVVGGVISDIQMNGGLTAIYSNFEAENLTIKGTQMVGGISGIIATQTLDGATVKDVTIVCSDARVGQVAGSLGGTSTISDIDVENVTGATAVIGGAYDGSKPVQAKIGDTFYATLENALNAQGNEVTLLVPYVVEAGETVVLDLKGKTISMVYAQDATANHEMIHNYGNLTIQDTVGGGKLSYTYTGGSLGTTYAANTITSEPDSVLTVKSGTIENLTYDSAVIAYAIDGRTNGGAGDVAVNIEGGTITSLRQSIRIFANSTTNTGTLNISGGEMVGRVIVQNSNANANKAALNITGGTFNANSYKSDVLYVGGSNSATMDINASISGGMFNGEITETHVQGFISGGTFNSPVNGAYCGAGFIPVDNGNGTYGVKEGAYIAQINAVKYETLAAALAAAQEGDTVELLADASVEGTAQIPAGVTIKSNGYKILGSIRMLGDLTLDGSLEITGGLWVGKAGETLAATLAGDKLTASYFMFQRGSYTIDANIDAVYGYLSFEGEFEVNSTITTSNTNGEPLYLRGQINLNEGASFIVKNLFLDNANTVLKVKKGASITAGSGVSLTTAGAQLYSSGDISGSISAIDGTTVSLTGGTYTQDVAEWCAEGYLCAEQNSNPVTYKVGRLPNAEVLNLGPVTVGPDGDLLFDEDGYFVYDLLGNQDQKLASSTEPFDLQIALNFVAKDSVEEAEKNAFGAYTTDFYITIDGIANGQFVADDNCYLAGYYPSFGAWVKIPLKGFTIENGKVYPVISSAGFDFDYVGICGSVSDFVCGIHLSDDVLAANPNLNVKLELGLSKTFEEAQSANSFITVDQPYVYDVEDLTKAVAISGPDYFTTVTGAVEAALETGDYVKLVKNNAVLEEDLELGGDLVLNLGGKTLTAADKKLVITDSVVTITNGTLSGFSAANITLTGNAILTVTDANVAASFRLDDTYYVSQNANDTHSIMLRSAFRVFITVVDGEPRIGFFKDCSGSEPTYTLLGATNLENPDWASVAYTQSDDASGASELPLYWVKLDQAADDTNVYRFFKIGPAPVNEQID